MSSDSLADQMNAYFREQADQPFGNVQLISGQTLAPFSRAGMEAADNLLAKAERALAKGDTERMTRLVDRAVQLKYDRHEDAAPAAYAAGMLLFNAIVDTLEDCPEGDSRWLEPALEVMASASGWGQSELRRLLLVVRKDYMIDRTESRAIRDAVATVPERVELIDAGLSPGDLAAAVTSVLQVVHEYRTALGRLDG